MPGPAPSSRPRIRERWAGLDLDAALTSNDLHLARLVVEGLSNPAIAVRLDTVEDIIKYRMLRIFRITGARSRIQLVVWMFETGHARPQPSRSPRPTAQLRLIAVRDRISTVRAELDSLAHDLRQAAAPGQPPRSDS